MAKKSDAPGLDTEAPVVNDGELAPCTKIVMEAPPEIPTQPGLATEDFQLIRKDC